MSDSIKFLSSCKPHLYHVSRHFLEHESMTGSLFKTIGRSAIQIGITSQTTIPTCLSWHAEWKSPNRHGHFSARGSAQKPLEFLGKGTRQRPAICLLSRQKWRVSATLRLMLSYCFSNEMCLEDQIGSAISHTK